MQIEKKSVLVVDDAKLSREILKRIINETEFARVSSEATNGNEAIQLVKMHKPDIVLIDLIMPGLGAIETIERIMKINKFTSILVISAIEEEDMILDAIKKGALDYVQKPFKKQQIIETLKRIIRK
jgi:two-component system chemotaxis response regulator CheY